MLGREVEPVAGAMEALAALDALGMPWRVASDSSHEELDAKFARIGMLPAVAGRLHSHLDVPRGKPRPTSSLPPPPPRGWQPPSASW